MIDFIVEKIISKLPPEVVSRQFKSVPRGIIDSKKYSTFQRTVRHAYKHSLFYKKKFDEFHIDVRKVKSPQDLGDFFTTPNDIVEHAEEFLCGRPDIVFESSGTTGKNKRVYFSQEELEQIGYYNATGLFSWGLTREDRIVNAFDFCFWIPGMVTQKGIDRSKIFCLIAGKCDPIEVYKRIATHRINVVFGEPTWLIKLTELAEKHGSFPMKLLIGGAEAMPEAARPWMEKVWQGAKVLMAYGSVESGGTIGFEQDTVCKNYHVNENSFFVEIVNPGPDGFGEVVFTTLDRTVMPLIRYKNRDISRIIEPQCECGLSFRKLAKMRGRTDEMVIASGGNLYPLMFEEIFKDVPGITSDWQIIFKLKGIKEVLEINLEVGNGAASAKALEEKIFSNIQSLYPDLWKNYSIGIFAIELSYHKPGSLRSDQRKIIRLLDKRHVSL